MQNSAGRLSSRLATVSISGAPGVVCHATMTLSEKVALTDPTADPS